MSIKRKVLVSGLDIMFASSLLLISFLIFTSAQLLDVDFRRHSIHDREFVNSNLQNFKLEASGNAQAERMSRLPTDVKPVMYTLKMVPELGGNFTFSGEVGIELEIKTNTTKITLHQYELSIKRVEVIRENSKLETNYTISSVDQTMTINVNEQMISGDTVRLNIWFQGQLKDEMKGFFRSSYEIGNTTKWLAMTQFKPTHARQAFPCFDELQYRVPFNIWIARYPHQKALSNMPLNMTSDSDESIDNRVWDTFATTPPMPTHLAAFVVGEFSEVTNGTGKVRVWAARDDASKSGSYWSSRAPELLETLEGLLGIPYPLPKLDMVAIPVYQASAMGDFGMVTYSERLQVRDGQIGNARNEELVTRLMVPAFIQQWFGGSVTPARWDDVWLDEAFGTYFEYYWPNITERREYELIVEDQRQTALLADESMVTIKPEEIDSIFDLIIYNKGGSVLRMLEHIVTPYVFWKALSQYLDSTYTESGGVGDPSMLFHAITETSANTSISLSAPSANTGISLPAPSANTGISLPAPISVIVEKFINQSGFPCVLVSRQQVSDVYNITFKQVPYKSPRSSQNIDDNIWMIPITCTTQSLLEFNNTQPTMWLVDKKENVSPNEVKKGEWCICNLQQTGYYRVNYDEENWKRLIEQLHSSHTKIHQLNRAQLIADATAFAKDDFLPHNTTFRLMSYLFHETDPIPWNRGLTEMHNLLRDHADSKAFELLRLFMKPIVGKFYSHVGFYEKAGDAHLVKTLRALLTFVACELGIAEPIAKVKSEFSRTDLSQIPADIKEAVLCVAIRTNSDITVWYKLWASYRNSNDDFERVAVLSAVGCAKNQTLLKKYLHKLVDNDDHDIRKQDEGIVFRSMTHFPTGVLATIGFVHDILASIENCTNTRNMVMKSLSSIMDRVQSAEQIHRLENVIEKAEKLKYVDITDVLKTVKANAMKLKARIDNEAEKIYAALTDLLGSKR